MLESWFETLKKHYLEDKHDLRADFIVYMLQGTIEIDFRVQRLKLKQGVQPAQLSQYDKERKARAMALDIAIARDMITENITERMVCVWFV